MTNNAVPIYDLEDVFNIFFSWLTINKTRKLIWSIAILECLVIALLGITHGWNYFGYVTVPYSAFILAVAGYSTRTPKEV